MPYNVFIDSEGIVRFTDSGFDADTMHDLIATYGPVYHPEFAIDELLVLNDANADGRPDPGESVDVQLTLRNIPRAVYGGTGISVVMSSNSNDITVTSDPVSFPDAEPGESTTGRALFSFTVNEGFATSWATLSFDWSCNYSEGSQTGSLDFEQRLGRPDLLIVDSDGSLDDNETFVTDAFDGLDREYDLWSGGDLPASEVANYSEIFWLGGKNTSDLNLDQANALADFMTEGGLLVLSSQYATDNAETADFFANSFGVTLADDDGGSIFLCSSPEDDAYFSAISIVATGTQGANNNETPDVLEISGGSNELFRWTQGDGGISAVYRHIYGEGLFIFAGFPLEAMRVYSSLPNSINYTGFVERVYAAYEMVTSVDDPIVAVPQEYQISQVYPNPFNPSTSISLQMTVAGDVELAVFDLLGRQVSVLNEGVLAAGEHQFSFRADGLGSGLYFVKLSVDGVLRDTASITLVK